MAKVETRAQALGINVRRVAAKTRTSLSRARAELAKVAALWSEADHAIEMEAEDLISRLDELTTDGLNASLEHLREPWGYDHG